MKFHLVQSRNNIGELKCPCHELGTLWYLKFTVLGGDTLHLQLNTRFDVYLVGFGDNPIPGEWLSKTKAIQKIASHYAIRWLTFNQKLGDIYANIPST